MSCIAIVGGTSALARRLIPILQEGGDVVTLGRRECDIPCDLLDSLDLIRIPEGTDAVVHVAAAFGGTADDDILRAVETNVNGTLKVCMAAKKADVRHLVLVSSLSAHLPVTSAYYGVYAITKRHAEDLAADYCSRNSILLSVLRPSQLYAEEESFRHHQPLIYQMADCAEKGIDISIYGTHDARRNYLYADDMARIIRGVLEKRCVGLYPCTFPKDVALSNVAEAALEAFGCGGRIVFLKDKPDIPDNIFGNSTELYEKIGFRPDVDVWQGMRRLAAHRRVANS